MTTVLSDNTLICVCEQN